MPVLSEFTSYMDWGPDAGRWSRMLHNRQISMGVDYFINNSHGSKASILDKNAGVFSKHKSEVEFGGKEKEILKGELRPGELRMDV